MASNESARAAAAATEDARREMSRVYRRMHSCGAFRVRSDAYDLAVLYLSTGRPELVKPSIIRSMLNGGRVVIAPVRAALADARRDCAGFNP